MPEADPDRYCSGAAAPKRRPDGIPSGRWTDMRRALRNAPSLRQAGNRRRPIRQRDGSGSSPVNPEGNRAGSPDQTAAWRAFSIAMLTRPESGAITSLISFSMASLFFEL